jgi:hypothetical protein
MPDVCFMYHRVGARLACMPYSAWHMPYTTATPHCPFERPERCLKLPQPPDRRAACMRKRGRPHKTECMHHALGRWEESGSEHYSRLPGLSDSCDMPQHEFQQTQINQPDSPENQPPSRYAETRNKLDLCQISEQAALMPQEKCVHC